MCRLLHPTRPPLALLAALALAAPGRAELPQEAYRTMQRDAPEAVTIEVVSVRTVERRAAHGRTVAVTAEARVRAVERTKSQLKAGAVIRISYDHEINEPPLPGPSPVPVIKAGKVYPAFLKKRPDGPGYTPAAGGYSFERVPDERRKDT